MEFKLLCCWDCGAQIVDGVKGIYTLRSTYRRVRFELADGSYMEPGFCQDCAERPWPRARCTMLEDAIAPTGKRVTILQQTKIYTVKPIVAVLDASMVPG